MAENSGLVIIDYFNSLDKQSRKDFRDKVLSETGMAYGSFYNKISGKTEFSKAEIYTIQQIIINKP